MTCDVWPLDAAPGELPPPELARLVAHLGACPACAELATVQASAAEALGRAAEGPPPPASLRAALVTRAEAAAKKAPPAPTPPAAVADDPRIRLLCTFCKDRFTSGDGGAIYCADCLAPVHRACFEDHGRCPAPGCGSPRWLEPGRPRRRSRAPRLLAVAVGLGLGVSVAALYATELAPGPRDHDPPPATDSVVVSDSVVAPPDAIVVASGAPAPEAPATPVGDRLRVLYVETQPRWEYRYLKSALLRDRRLAVQTVLLSADPGFVQDSSDGLPPLSSLPSPGRLRDYDVIVLGDVAQREDRLYPGAFVAIGAAVDAGAGLVVIDGQDSGAAWERTALGPLLPVRFDAELGERVGEFQLTRTAAGEAHPALRLDADPAEDRWVWGTLPDLHWSAPAREATSDAELLAVHPETTRPLVALRRQGQGRVAWLGVDETWRWRAGVGDRFMARLHGNLVRFVSTGRGEVRPLPRLWLQDGTEVPADLALFRRGAGQFVATARGNVRLADVARISVATSDPCPSGLGFVLHDGSVVWGELLRGDDTQVVVRAVLLGELRLAVDELRGVVTSKSAAEATEPARWIGEPQQDRVVTHDGRILTGVVLFAGADRLELGLEKLGRLEVGWDAIRTVDLAPIAGRGSSAEAPRVFVRLSTGTALRATLGDLDGDVVRLRHPLLGALAVPRHLVLDVRFER